MTLREKEVEVLSVVTVLNCVEVGMVAHCWAMDAARTGASQDWM